MAYNKEVQKRYNDLHKEEIKKRKKDYYKKNKEKILKYKKENKEKIKILNQNLHLKNTFGITLEQYNKLLEEHNGVCAICKTKEFIKDSIGNVRRLAVDHNHKTGKIRGLLCFNCNQMLGKAKDNKQILINAIEYLTKE